MTDRLAIAVCGSGAWGTAMALHLHRLGCQVTLISRREEHAAQLRADAENKEYLPGFPLPPDIAVKAELPEALETADAVFMAAPSYTLTEWIARIEQAVDLSRIDVPFISLAKGLDIETQRTPCQILSHGHPRLNVGCLSGPTFAGEVASGKPTAMTLACAHVDERVQALQNAASGSRMRIYLSHDLRGVELGGCLKNVYAIAAGCCQGLGLGDNALAALVTRALTEMVRVGQALGARMETFYGLSGFGDLIATCYGAWSRNRTFGERIAKGETAEQIIASQHKAVEGYRTAKAFHDACADKRIEAPILSQVFDILYRSKPPMEALGALMSRDLKHEHAHG